MEKSNQYKLFLKKIANLNGIEVDDTQIDQMATYVDLLLEKNKVVNLISRKDTEKVWESHIIHSISILFKFSFPKNVTILDLGTGGGLPGIPVKILRPDIDLTLVDSIKKKIDAINEFVQKLRLLRTKAIWSRAEDLGKEHLNHYNIVISRAVAPLKDLIKWSYPLIKKGGTSTLSSVLIALKGGDLEKEIKQAKLYGKYKEIDVKDLIIAGIDTTVLEDKKIVVVKFSV
ncbi:MAG: 16S rRNA (guanine(527)-N(7))-methyltransferase RsmG [Bacteroidota bacterium]|nr:16S rRNA (guanine(527)-N(7))-methyltransferase RsmG [Bacteroidota bacterium]